MIGENCKKSFMNIMLIPLNGKRLYFNLCNFRYIVANKMQPTINISSYNDELDIGPYIYDCVGFGYNGVFIN